MSVTIVKRHTLTIAPPPMPMPRPAPPSPLGSSRIICDGFDPTPAEVRYSDVDDGCPDVLGSPLLASFADAIGLHT